MSVNLSGGDVGVTKHFLDRAEVGAVKEEVCGKLMTELMRRDVA